MFRELEYQQRVLTAFDCFIEYLREGTVTAERVAEAMKVSSKLDSFMPNYVEAVWEALRSEGRLPSGRQGIPYSPRADGCGRPVPNAVLKVPTGGGKTWLAVNCVSRILGSYLGKYNGFVLWIVPNEIIYSQTRAHLRDRQSPYRQTLERLSAGNVLILDKTSKLSVQDVEENLCVMLLMLQSANRETKETLKVFQDRGDVYGFFPSDGNQLEHRELSGIINNLDVYGDAFPIIKDSLGNALRMIRPVVVVDEGHRAISELAFNTLYGFNPCFVLELTATPQDVLPRAGKRPRRGRPANVLIEVSGKELDREGMIKMPLVLDSRSGSDWKSTLNVALTKLEEKNAAAVEYRSETNQYIRPILLVQVERTGSDQRDSGYLHADDVKEYLLTVGFDQTEVAIKSSEVDELKQPENQDLLSPTNRIRIIITKKALQEGWDCPFAYVLCSLASSTSNTAITQLIGRILRQPYAVKTGVSELDECYVVTQHESTRRAADIVRRGLEREGLGDLTMQVQQEDEQIAGSETEVVGRRREHQSTEIFLPKILVSDNGEVRDIDYETDILSMLDWRKFNPVSIAERISLNGHFGAKQLQRIHIGEGEEEHFVGESISTVQSESEFPMVHAVRMIQDIVPNPFVGYTIVEKFVKRLNDRGIGGAKLGNVAGFVVDALKNSLESERMQMAEEVFRDSLKRGKIQFRLRMDGKNWRMPLELKRVSNLNKPRQLVGADGSALERSLFSPIYEEELNSDERDVAVYLDSNKALKWWHRNVARTHYGLQGWKREKVYPDFVFRSRKNRTEDCITVLETKGDHLDNDDAKYKRNLLKYLTEEFKWDDSVPAGELQLVKNTGETVCCKLILMSEWRTSLAKHIGGMEGMED